MESIKWFIDLESGAVVSGTYEDQLRFDIFVGTTHIDSSAIKYSVAVSAEQEDTKRRTFDEYAEAMNYIDLVVSGETQVWFS